MLISESGRKNNLYEFFHTETRETVENTDYHRFIPAVRHGLFKGVLKPGICFLSYFNELKKQKRRQRDLEIIKAQFQAFLSFIIKKLIFTNHLIYWNPNFQLLPL